MKKCAILIAVEEFLDEEIAAVRHARRDAEAFAKVLASHGFATADTLLLIDNQATKSVVESKVRRAIRRLEPTDTLLFYYAGRACSQQSRNLLACYDTQASDWDLTSVPLGLILEEIKAAGCEQTVLLLDCSPREESPGDGLEILEPFNLRELEQFVDDAGEAVCFAACRPDEISHASDHLRHRIWMHHVIEAFAGDAPAAVEKGFLTATSLQNFVSAEVTRTLRKEHASPKGQTPWMHSHSADMVLADMRKLLAERRANASAGDLITELSFVVQKTVDIRNLPAWKPTYRIPQTASGSNQTFIAQVATQELTADLDRIFDRLKSAFQFSRRDLESSPPEDGAATIITPHFNYSIAVSLNTENPREVFFTRTVDAIRNPDQITSPPFAEVFDGVFDTLHFSFSTRVNIADFIDAVEAASIADLQLKYDREATYCEFLIRGGTGTVTVRPSNLSIVHSGPRTTEQLIDSFDTIRQLVQKHHVPLLSFTAPRGK